VTVWVSEVITTQAGVRFRNDALQFDPTTRPTLLYLAQTGNSPTPSLYMARKEGAAWQIEPIGQGEQEPPALAFDAENRPHASWVKGGTVYHAQRDNGNWNPLVVDQGKGANATAIGARGDGSIGIVFSTRFAEPPRLYHAQRASNTWNVETALTGTPAGSLPTDWFTGQLSFGYDNQGRPNIVFTNMNIGLSPLPSTWLEHAIKINGEWRTHPITSDMYVTGQALQVAAGSSSFLAYSTFGPACDEPCLRRSTLSIAAIDDDGSPNQPFFARGDSDLAALAVHDGKPAILQRRESATGAELRYDWTAAGGITSGQIVTGDFGSAALAFNRRGEPLIVYYAPERGQLVAVRAVQVAFPYGLHLPLISVSR
jgi:hypothetical protein